MERSLWLVSLTHMFIEVYFLVQVALIPVFVREFRLSLFEASLVATVPNIVALLMNIPIGYLADRVSTNCILAAAMIIESASAFAISQANSFWLLVLCVTAMRISSPLYHITGLSNISRAVTRERMSRSMGVHNALGSLGVASGLVSLSVFQSTIGWRWIYVFWTVPVFAWGLIVLKSSQLKTTGTGRPDRGDVLGTLPLIFSVGFVTFLVAVGLREVGSTGTSTFMTTYLVRTRGVTEAVASFVFGLGPFTGILGSLVGGYLGDKIGAKRTLDFAVVGCILSLAALAFCSQLFPLTVLYVVYAFFSNTVWSPMNTLVTDLTPKAERGLSFSVYFLTEGVIVAATPVLTAAVIGLTDVWTIFPFGILFLVAGLVTLQLLSHR